MSIQTFFDKIVFLLKHKEKLVYFIKAGNKGIHWKSRNQCHCNRFPDQRKRRISAMCLNPSENSIHLNVNRIFVEIGEFLTCNFYRRRNQSPKLSEFQFLLLCYPSVKFEGHTKYQSQIIVNFNQEHPSKYFWPKVFSGQILEDIRLQLRLQ